MIQEISGAPWRSEGGFCAVYLLNLPQLASLLDPPRVPFFKSPPGGEYASELTGP